MKKKILGFIAVCAIAAISAWNVDLGKNQVKLTDLTLENIEALAEGECEPIVLGTCWYSSYNHACCEGGDEGCAPCDGMM